MRVLLLAQFYPPVVGGEERHVSNLADALADRGHDVTVATQWIPDAPSFEMVGRVKVHRISGTLQRLGGLFSEDQRRHAPPFPDPELVTGLWRIVKQEQPDIVHAHNWMYMSYLPIKRRAGVPLVVTLHDYSLICPKKNFMRQDMPCTGPRLFKCVSCAKQHYGTTKGVVTTEGLYAFGKLVRYMTDKFITVSHAVAEYNRLREFDLSYEVIPNFVPDDVGSLTPADRYADHLKQLPSEYMLFVGDPMRLKGIEVLFDAYQRLYDPPPLVLIGRHLPGTPPLPPNVLHLGPWPHDAVMHAWDRCLFGVLPSIGLETFGIVIIEAMSRGKPFIASDIGGMSDVIEDKETGLLVPPGDVSALTQAMRFLIENPEWTERLGRTAARQIDRFKAAPVVSRIEETYRALVD